MASILEVESVKRQVDIYSQMKAQLLSEMKRYSKEGKEELAKIIAQSLDG